MKIRTQNWLVLMSTFTIRSTERTGMWRRCQRLYTEHDASQYVPANRANNRARTMFVREAAQCTFVSSTEETQRAQQVVAARTFHVIYNAYLWYVWEFEKLNNVTYRLKVLYVIGTVPSY